MIVHGTASTVEKLGSRRTTTMYRASRTEDSAQVPPFSDTSPSAKCLRYQLHSSILIHLAPTHCAKAPPLLRSSSTYPWDIQNVLRQLKSIIVIQRTQPIGVSGKAATQWSIVYACTPFPRLHLWWVGRMSPTLSRSLFLFYIPIHELFSVCLL